VASSSATAAKSGQLDSRVGSRRSSATARADQLPLTIAAASWATGAGQLRLLAGRMRDRQPGQVDRSIALILRREDR
jgi:hypothetical protein